MDAKSTLAVMALMNEYKSRDRSPGAAERLAQREDTLKLHAARWAAGSPVTVWYAEQQPWVIKSINFGSTLVCEDAFASLLRTPADVSTLRSLLVRNVRVIDCTTNIELGQHILLLERLGLVWDQSGEIQRLRDEMRSSNDAFARDIASIGSRVAADMVSNGLFHLMRKAVDNAFKPQGGTPPAAPVSSAV